MASSSLCADPMSVVDLTKGRLLVTFSIGGRSTLLFFSLCQTLVPPTLLGTESGAWSEHCF
jgi:hypothetical protein